MKELEQAKAYCKANGADFDALCRQAYPDEDIPKVRDAPLRWRYKSILDGLEEINWHRLVAVFCEKFGDA